jgi:acyl carrier protein|tara:strand:- start:93 stop:347 length:255 start_codon:yes stop_codon:yes gene_type:complete
MKKKIDHKITSILSSILQVSKSKIIQNKKQSKEYLNWDSINQIKIILEIEKEFKIKFKSKDVLTTVNNRKKLLDAVLKKISNKD